MSLSENTECSEGREESQPPGPQAPRSPAAGRRSASPTPRERASAGAEPGVQAAGRRLPSQSLHTSSSRAPTAAAPQPGLCPPAGSTPAPARRASREADPRRPGTAAGAGCRRDTACLAKTRVQWPEPAQRGRRTRGLLAPGPLAQTARCGGRGRGRRDRCCPRRVQPHDLSFSPETVLGRARAPSPRRRFPNTQQGHHLSLSI